MIFKWRGVAEVKCWPVNPSGQLHVKWFTWSTQTPSFWHGEELHSLTSASHSKPSRDKTHTKTCGTSFYLILVTINKQPIRHYFYYLYYYFVLMWQVLLSCILLLYPHIHAGPLWELNELKGDKRDVFISCCHKPSFHPRIFNASKCLQIWLIEMLIIDKIEAKCRDNLCLFEFSA